MTYRKVRHRLASLQAIGYSSSGIVLAVADDVADLRPGDKVACAGEGYASHAQVIFAPRNLCAIVPAGLELESAAFGTMGAIAMHGLRQAQVSLGETIVVLGLGTIGLLTTYLARAAGCQVIGVDPIESKRTVAACLGAESVAASAQAAAKAVHAASAGGADSVIICASSPGSELINVAAQLARDRARIVALGLTGLDVPRQSYYEKELTLHMSRSYGPGRYDQRYEADGHDYPIGYVRWTEQRNIEGFLQLVARDTEVLDRLISHRIPFDEGEKAYEILRTAPEATGIVLTYGTEPRLSSKIHLAALTRRKPAPINVGVIGAGNFAQGVLLPILSKKSDVRLKAIATSSGVVGRSVGERYDCQYVTGDYREVLNDPTVDAVVVCTRHDTHAAILVDALRSEKCVFVEKPLAICSDQLALIEATMKESEAWFMVGFNRRHSPLIGRAIRFLNGSDRQPLIMNYTINAGPLPETHWIHAENQGGRVVGEVCHFIDTVAYLSRSRPVTVFARSTAQNAIDGDVVTTVAFANGSIASIAYSAGGDPRAGKERLEVMGDGKMCVIDNFKSCVMTTGGHQQTVKVRRADKGHDVEIDRFVEALRDGVFDRAEMERAISTTRATLAIGESIRSGRPIEL